ncbi:unnamed protein product [Penicillium olsonii]|uniref:Major facilitator superfamily (MFS) profile domain-containing protein n=1 Tax=Penicillium olsonii TaxID=99116 RepID=A0A9W4MVW8_PENOL|nr:unnamed protein product [Penicillium olsonii]CAG8303336.1 unnamed protein product [Penicillium olsonii]
MLFAYMMAFLDKQTLNYAALMGIREDLHLVGSEYNWSSSIFYFGYLIFSYPASLLMVKFPLGKYLSTVFILWSVILACHAATTNFAGLMVARFFLGCAEASLSPGFTLITSLWYRTSEQPLRHGIWFCGNSLSLIFGNLIAVGILQIDDRLKAWQWLFIIFGIITFLWGIVMLFRLPDSPATASFLTDEEKIIATERLKANQTGFKNSKIDKSQIMEAFVDIKTWLLAVLILAANIPNGGFTTVRQSGSIFYMKLTHIGILLQFNGLVLQGFGFSTFHTLLLGIPGGAIVFIFVLSSGVISSKIANTRCLTMIACNVISIIGSSLIYATGSVGSRYAGLLLMGIYSAAMPISMAMISSNIGGFTKKATVSAVFFIMYCVGNIVGPQLFFEREAPKYQSGFLAIIICLVVCVLDGFGLLFFLRWTNARRERTRVAGTVSQDQEKEDQIGEPILLDTTDLKNKEFRYVY